MKSMSRSSSSSGISPKPTTNDSSCMISPKTAIRGILFLLCMGQAVDCSLHKTSPLAFFVQQPQPFFRSKKSRPDKESSASATLFSLHPFSRSTNGDETMTATETTSSTTMQTPLPSTAATLEQAAISTTTTIRNFRPARGLEGVYRCGSTDCLADVVVLDVDIKNNDALPDEDDDASKRVLSFHKGLIVDLRSAAERDEVKAQQWMSLASGGSWKVARDDDFWMDTKQNQQQQQDLSERINRHGDDDNSNYDRLVLRIDVLQMGRFAAYVNQNWLPSSSSSSSSNSSRKTIDEKEMQQLRMDELNKRGLLGLNQAILETGKDELCAALKAITQFRECHHRHHQDSLSAAAADDDVVVVPVVIHCVQGKDRTGVLVMLCQSLLGVSEEDVIADYHLSASMLALSPEKTSAAADNVGHYGRLDRRIFSEAPAIVMQETLAWMRDRYGSIEQGYFDDIGFDERWRQRFKRVVGGAAAVNAETSSSSSRL